ncbi:unnamed protein product, partial [Rotaria sp. Silwood1]
FDMLDIYHRKCIKAIGRCILVHFGQYEIIIERAFQLIHRIHPSIDTINERYQLITYTLNDIIQRCQNEQFEELTFIQCMTIAKDKIENISLNCQSISTFIDVLLVHGSDILTNINLLNLTSSQLTTQHFLNLFDQQNIEIKTTIVFGLIKLFLSSRLEANIALLEIILDYRFSNGYRSINQYQRDDITSFFYFFYSFINYPNLPLIISNSIKNIEEQIQSCLKLIKKLTNDNNDDQRSCSPSPSSLINSKRISSTFKPSIISSPNVLYDRTNQIIINNDNRLLSKGIKRKLNINRYMTLDFENDTDDFF